MALMHAVVLATLVAAAPDEGVEGRTCRLTMARVLPNRGLNLEITLVPATGHGAEVVLKFPAHSLTRHEQDLMKVIMEAVPNLGREEKPAHGRVWFTLPPGTSSGYYGNQEFWEKVRATSDREKQ